MENNHRKLKLTDGVFYAVRGRKHLFLQPRVPDWLVVDQNGAILLSRCDGRATLGEILAPIPTLGSLQPQAEALFSEALRRGILTDLTSAQTADPEVVPLAKRPSGKPALCSVYLKLTNQCNLHCKYCYANSGRPSDAFTLKDLESIASDVATISPSVEYVLSGGEPFLNTNAHDFAKVVKKAGNRVHILTNGTLIDEKNAETVSKVADLIKISLDGSCEEVHSRTRGESNFEKVVRAIDLLSELKANVIIAMTVTRENRSDVSNLVSRYGSRLALQPLFKAGRGQDMDELSLTGLEYYYALASVDGVAPMGMIARTLESIRGHGVSRCALADREISISETGDVYPCQLLHTDAFKAGNVRENSLAEIYYKSPIFNRLRGITVDTLGKCSTCPIRYICGGACRARDFYEVGSIEEVGEFCEYETEAFITGIFESVEMQSI